MARIFRLRPGAPVFDLDVPDCIERGDLARAQHQRPRAPVPLDAHQDTHPGFAIDDGSAQHEVDQQLRTLYAVIDRQSPMDPALLLLWLEDRSQREIAEVIGISESNVATKLNRLKQRIRQQLANPAFD